MTREDPVRCSRRGFQATAAGLAGAALAGCLDSFGIRADRSVGFEETDLDYAGVEGGVGFGNSGLYVSDYDNDGLPELLALGGDRPVLFQNEDGELTPTDLLDDLGEPGRMFQTAVFFDHDRNGWEDLLLLEQHGPAHFFANVDGEFESSDLGLDVEFAVPTSVAVADASGNGLLDLFIAHMGDWADGVPAGWARDEDAGVLEEDNGAPNLLFWNEGGSFRQAEDAGVSGKRWSLATSFIDLTGDGRQDIHVANDFNRDVIYLNQGDGQFDQLILPEQTDRNGMSSLVTDVSGNGLPDILVTNIFFPLDDIDEDEEADRLRRHFEFVLQSPRIEGNNLIVNHGNGEFTFEASAYGLAEGGWGWAAIAADFDHDGQEELVHATQNIFEVYDPPVFTYPMYFKRDGERYERQDAAELGFSPGNDRSTVLLDANGDGTMDIAIGAYNDRFRLYRNQLGSGRDRHSIQLDLRDSTGAVAIGSTVRLDAGERTYHRFLTSGSDYQSQSTRLLHVGLGEADTVDELAIRWPDGTETVLEALESDQRLQISPAGIEDATPFE